MITDKSKLFITDNLTLASVLRSEGHVLKNVNKKDPKHALFEFIFTQELSNTVNDFWADKLRLEPKALTASVKQLKTYLYDHSFQTL